jgi:hypothetical protein
MGDRTSSAKSRKPPKRIYVSLDSEDGTHMAEFLRSDLETEIKNENERFCGHYGPVLVYELKEKAK